MSLPNTVDAAVSRAIAFLAGRQTPHGEFRTCCSKDRNLDHDPSFDSSPYSTTYMLYSLGFARDARIEDLTGRAISFLAQEMESPGVWRYYSSRCAKVLPPDLDDTACAAFALRHCHDEIQMGFHLPVILANRDENGRFKTFLTDGQNNVDAGVNANVLFYLGEREETRAACDYLCQVVMQGQEKRDLLYWVDDLSSYYVLSRAFFQGITGLGCCRDRVLHNISARQQEDGSFGDELATALAIASLINFGGGQRQDLARAAGTLLARQRQDGSWPGRTFYIDFAGGFYGSEELTTAFAVEALVRSCPSPR